MLEPARVFADRLSPGDWCVEWEHDNTEVEVTIFRGPDARDRAFQYANCRYADFVVSRQENAEELGLEGNKRAQGASR